VAPGTAARAAAVEETRRCAHAFELETPDLDTDYRTHNERYLPWGYSHGAALAAMALALGLERTLIASTYMRGEVAPWGSSIHLDQRFSTERTRIVHHGDATRPEKVSRVAAEPLARETLRICFKQSTGNCGRCQRCVPTMLQLHAAGAWNDFRHRFDAPLSAELVAKTEPAPRGRHAWVELAANLEGDPSDRPYLDAVRMVIVRSDLMRAEAALRQAADAEGEPTGAATAELNGALADVVSARARLERAAEGGDGSGWRAGRGLAALLPGR
jgi:hypothetical protein